MPPARGHTRVGIGGEWPRHSKTILRWTPALSLSVGGTAEIMKADRWLLEILAEPLGHPFYLVGADMLVMPPNIY